MDRVFGVHMEVGLLLFTKGFQLLRDWARILGIGDNFEKHLPRGLLVRLLPLGILMDAFSDIVCSKIKI